ncbi:TetR/AcrR family transcriptional regulator C-terminal domain-containing protein [Rhodococcoides yunnanense]|uniref:TetR/AcrR family transcriptional regulator C-terminal domain-containing protein n=1 Tax=Rhodococcoides yunnanense TaxID=278209 RepID=UPI001475BC48|nr:TetR/AcrR family transcriptional regulator C-terminal domain-containing protein [Rhodococcus yunnanensis]
MSAAVEILDADGEHALTMRTLTEHFTTGRGAIYHHVSGMDDLLAAAADDVIAVVTTPATAQLDPVASLRHLAVGVYDAVDRHHWVGTQLARDSMQPAVLRIWKGVAVALREIGLTGSSAANAGSALSSFLFGSTAHIASRSRRSHDPESRRAFLDALASYWTADDPEPTTIEAAAHLRDHDDREQFVAGLDIVLRGITAAP